MFLENNKISQLIWHFHKTQQNEFNRFLIDKCSIVRNSIKNLKERMEDELTICLDSTACKL